MPVKRSLEYIRTPTRDTTVSFVQADGNDVRRIQIAFPEVHLAQQPSDTGLIVAHIALVIIAIVEGNGTKLRMNFNLISTQRQIGCRPFGQSLAPMTLPLQASSKSIH